MSSRTAHRPPGKRPPTGRQAKVQQVQAAAARASRGRRLRHVAAWGAVLSVIAGLVAAMMWNARDTSDTTARSAPGFSLSDTNGTMVRLGDYRGRNVLLYFSEGAGCQSCLLQMADIEKNAASFAEAGVTVLPIVMNPADQIRADMAANGVKTPFLLDDGTVSRAYGTLGKGMHDGLPGHSFVLIDPNGVQRWYGEFPSMYVSASELLGQVRA